MRKYALAYAGLFIGWWHILWCEHHMRKRKRQVDAIEATTERIGYHRDAAREAVSVVDRVL